MFELLTTPRNVDCGNNPSIPKPSGPNRIGSLADASCEHPHYTTQNGGNPWDKQPLVQEFFH